MGSWAELTFILLTLLWQSISSTLLRSATSLENDHTANFLFALMAPLIMVREPEGKKQKTHVSSMKQDILI
jgi:hypothetical protein